MLIDFNAISEVTVPHFKGGEGHVLLHKFVDERMGSVVKITIPQGCSIGYHTHQGNCEFVVVLSGQGVCTDDGESYVLRPGMYTYCPEGHTHGIVNNEPEPLVLLGVLPDIH